MQRPALSSRLKALLALYLSCTEEDINGRPDGLSPPDDLVELIAFRAAGAAYVEVLHDLVKTVHDFKTVYPRMPRGITVGDEANVATEKRSHAFDTGTAKSKGLGQSPVASSEAGLKIPSLRKKT